MSWDGEPWRRYNDAMVLCAECQRQIEDGSRFCPYCGTALPAEAPASADPFLGAVVNGKYRVEALVGRGGMGRVYRARHLTLDRVVVLKMLHRAYSGNPQIVKRFQREARAASRLDHPNSIAVLDFGEAEDGTLFMVMEYLDGKDLGRVLQEEFPLREKRIVGMGTQVLSALSEAHAKGIIHRDLKPENVMVVPRRHLGKPGRVAAAAQVDGPVSRRHPLPEPLRACRGLPPPGGGQGAPGRGGGDGVSEALYLHDPDQNGVELYWERPREQWPRDAEGGVAMYTRRLDLESLLAEAMVGGTGAFGDTRNYWACRTY